MIILDLNQVMLSNLMMSLGSHTNTKIEPDLIRHMVLNSIRMYMTKFKEDFGELVIACDNKRYWRRDIFPYYKASRKKDREKSDLDWKAVFECLHMIRAELTEYFPYRIIDVDGAEADDVIGSLVQHFGNDMMEPILILSADKDFIQLQQFLNVKQFDPIRKKYVSHNNPAQYTKEHILRGDAGDGVPNVLSPDNCFVIGTRQKPVTTKKLEQWLQMLPEAFCDDNLLRNYKRNQQLIDLNFIPEEIKKNIINQYETQSGKGRSKLFNYFVQFKLRNLMESIGDF